MVQTHPLDRQWPPAVVDRDVQPRLVEPREAAGLERGHAVERRVPGADLPERPPARRLVRQGPHVRGDGLATDEPPPVGSHLAGHRPVVDPQAP
jgi:hypothetical protein